MTGDHRRNRNLSRTLPAVATMLGLLLLIRGVDLARAGAALRDADARWLLLATALTGLSVTAGAICWGSLVRDRCPALGRRCLGLWHVRALLAGQLLPAGAGGDAVRAVAIGRVAGAGTALGSIAMSRLMGAIGMVAWGVAGAVILRDAVGPTAVAVSGGVLGLMVLALAAALHAEAVVAACDRGRTGWRHRVAVALAPLATTLSAWRRRPGLLSRVLLVAAAGWGLNLAALTLLGRAVGVDVGWQVFAVTIPVTLTATLVPLSANGIGVREGLLVGLLVHAGVGSGQAAALSLLVDLQMLPFAALGGLVWLRLPTSLRLPAPAPAPPPLPVAARP